MYDLLSLDPGPLASAETITLMHAFRLAELRIEFLNITPSADHGRRPKSGPNLDGGEDPGRLSFTLNDRFGSRRLEALSP